MADSILQQGVQSIAELILIPGEINLDFADVRAVMENAGPAWMAIGKGSGPDCAVIAAREAVRSPLLEVSIEGATGVIFNVTGGTDLTLDKVHQAAQVISEMVHPDANIIFGSVTDPKLENEVKLTVIATGFPVEDEEVIEPETPGEPVPVQEMDAETLAIPPFLRHHPAGEKAHSRQPPRFGFPKLFLRAAPYPVSRRSVFASPCANPVASCARNCLAGAVRAKAMRLMRG